MRVLHTPRNSAILICALLACIAVASYWPAWGNGFVNYDDPLYITANAIVQQGVTARGIAWAFSGIHAANYHPLTWLSHMLDCQWFGLHAGGHHAVSVALHALNGVLLFLVLSRMTGRAGLSALVAAIFAAHPGHVESVAWAAERKDVLSATFWILAMGAYARFVDRPDAARYALVCLLFVCGLLSKSMVVTLPCALLLLDIWPLGRTRLAFPAREDAPRRRRSVRFLLAEKLPMFALAGGMGVVTWMAQRAAGAMEGGRAAMSFGQRLGNAAVSYARYLGELFWPTNLSAFYPRQAWSSWQIAGAVVLLVVLTLAALSVRRRNPYMLVGWLWFLGTLVPVIGIVQVGSQSMADRYLYLPMIGVLLAIVWGVSEALGDRLKTTVGILWCGIACAAAIIGCAVATHADVKVWRNSESLYAQCLNAAPGNAFVEQNLAAALIDDGKVNQSLMHFRRAVELQPELPDGRGGYGHALRLAGRYDQAAKQLAIGLKLNGRDPRLHIELGMVFFDQQRWSDAAARFERALAIDPGTNFEEVNLKLGTALLAGGQGRAAIGPLKRAIALEPDSAQALVALSWVRSTSPDAELRNGAEAQTLAARADRLTGGRSADVLDALAAAEAETGQFDHASQTARRAAALARQAGAAQRAADLDARALQYKNRAPWRDPTLASADADADGMDR